MHAVDIVRLCVDKAGSERAEILVKNILTRCGKGGYGSAVKAVFEGDYR